MNWISNLGEYGAYLFMFFASGFNFALIMGLVRFIILTFIERHENNV